MEAERETASTLGKGHGRLEHRRLISSTLLNEHLDWPGVKQGSAPQILAGVRNLAINWLRNLKIDNIAQALRENGWNPQRLFAMLGKPVQ